MKKQFKLLMKNLNMLTQKTAVSWLTDKWKKEALVYYTHTHTQYYSALFQKKKKKEWNSAICNSMGGPGDYHTKWNKQDKDRRLMILFRCEI